MAMLVLTRKVDEQIQIGDGITVTVVRLSNQSVRIGIDAPREASIMRAERLADADAEGAGDRPSSSERARQ